MVLTTKSRTTERKNTKKHVNMQTGRDQAESETAVVDILETNIQMTHYVQHI